MSDGAGIDLHPDVGSGDADHRRQRGVQAFEISRPRPRDIASRHPGWVTL